MKNIQVAYIIDEYRLALNIGSADGVENGQRYLVYTLSDQEIHDPSTNESLGFLEIVKGTGMIENVQEHLCTLKSCTFTSRTKSISRNNRFSNILGTSEECEIENELEPFDFPEIGDYAKPI